MTRTAPSVLACFLAIARFHATSRMFGMRRAVRAARRRVPCAPDITAEPAIIDETARRVALAGAFYPARALCLEQSLALCALLRARGVAAELRIGVQSRPFQAHAWVEAGGRVVNEREEVVRLFATFPLAEV
jgi:transglutaminase-like putative cysteine protease